MDRAIELDPEERANRVLRGNILDRLGRKDEARAEWQDAVDGKLDLEAMDDFTLSWPETAAWWLDSDALRQCIQQRRHRLGEKKVLVQRQGELPARFDVTPSDCVPS